MELQRAMVRSVFLSAILRLLSDSTVYLGIAGRDLTPLVGRPQRLIRSVTGALVIMGDTFQFCSDVPLRGNPRLPGGL